MRDLPLGGLLVFSPVPCWHEVDPVMTDNILEASASDERTLIEATFRNGSITAIGVVVGFSLGFLSRWSALPGQWTHTDLLSVALITIGLGLQIKSLADLLLVTCLQLKRYNRAIRYFLIGLSMVGIGILIAIFSDLVGLRGIVLQG